MGAEFDGALQIGAKESVVNDDGEIALVGQLGDGGDIRDAEGGIGGRFNVDQFGVRPNRRFDLRGVVGIDQRDLNAEPLAKVLDQQSVDAVLGWTSIPETARRKLLWDNAVRCYRRYRGGGAA